jgi:Global regulator protein family
MLVVTRKLNECLCIGDNNNGIYVTVIELRGDKVRLGVSDKPTGKNAGAGKHDDSVQQVYANLSATLNGDSVAGTATGRQSLRADGAGGAAGPHLPDAPDHKTLISQLFAGDADTRKDAARELGVLFKDSPAVAVLSALEAVLRQDPDSPLRAVLTVAIKAIAGKKHLDEFLKTIKDGALEHNQQASPLPVPPKLENVKALFTGLSDGHESRISDLEAINQAYRQELANQVAHTLNARIQAMPHDTLDAKRDLARQVNEELRGFDLAIKGPTGQPSTLLAVPGHPPNEEVGRLFLDYKSPEGKRSRTHLPPELSAFELMDAAPRREALREWMGKVGQPPGGARRA